jgi:hypothetical protein
MKGATNMAEPSQEQLLTYIDAAMTFYQQVKGQGRASTNKQIQALLATCGIHVTLPCINTNREIIQELEQAEEQQETPPGDYGWPYFSSYLLPGRPTEKKE